MFKQILITLILSLLASTSAFAASARVQVNGMVCAFCAQGIKKKFSGEAAVEKVGVDLDQKLVTLDFKPGQTLSDKAITDVIVSAGYNVVKVDREEKK